jgi:hypothetical protein
MSHRRQDLLELEALAGFCDRHGRLLGTARHARRPGARQRVVPGHARCSLAIHPPFTDGRHASGMTDHPGLSLHEREQCATGLQHAERALHEELDERLGAATVTECIAEVTARFADATVLTFVPLLVRRYAREELLRRLDTIDVRSLTPEPAVTGVD